MIEGVIRKDKDSVGSETDCIDGGACSQYSMVLKLSPFAKVCLFRRIELSLKRRIYNYFIVVCHSLTDFLGGKKLFKLI